jgi:hypothetical protein
MKRALLTAMVLLAACLATVGAMAAPVVMLDNGNFESSEEPRTGYQGWDDECIYGWKPFAGLAWMSSGKEHVAVVEAPDAVGGHYLKLVGVENNYVGIRSVHMPVEKNGMYTLSAKAFVKELADPSRVQVWLEFWPENPKSESSSYRLKYSRANAGEIGCWQELEVSDIAPPEAATVTALIIIHKTGKGPSLPAEAYVDDVRLQAVQ